MIIGEFDVSISDYWGRMGEGVAVIISILYKEGVYEGLYCYTDVETDTIFEVDNDLEKELDCSIDETLEYEDIMKFISENTVGYDDIITELDEIIL